MPEHKLKDGERLDETGFGNIKVIQRRGMGYGVDSVLLAAFAAGETGARRIKASSRIADLGTGSGIIAFVLAHKLKDGDVKIDGFELRADAYDRACRACEMSGLSDRVSFTCTDIHDIESSLFGSYDAIVSNPPYFKRAAAIPNANSDKFTARHETTADLADFAQCASRLLRDGGSFYMVHRPDRLADIICEMRTAGVEPKELQFVVPRAGETANILLVHGIKGAGSEMKLLPEISVHEDEDTYTDFIEELYERKR